MSFIFRKRIKILPGIWLNLSKGGISTSFGGKGITVNIKDDEVKTTASIPGTGLSYRTTSNDTPEGAATKRAGISGWVWVLVVMFIVVMFVVK